MNAAIDAPATVTVAQNAAWAALVPTMTERVFQDHVIRAARELGYLCYHTHDSRHSAAGYPDLCCARGDRLIFLELKREGRELTIAQTVWVEALRRAGVEVYAPVHPSDYDQLLAILRGPRYAAPPQPAEDGGGE